MLEEIIDSSQKSAVVAFFALAPERSYSSKELSGRLQIPESALLKLLQLFVKMKMISVFSKKTEKYYIANGKNKFFADIRTSLLKQNPKYEDELFIAIKKLGNVKAAYLSGLFTAQPQLPVDILIVGTVSDTKLVKFLDDLGKMMGQEINYTVMDSEEFDVRFNTFDRFIKDIFDYPHLVVIEPPTPKAKK